MLPDTGLAIKHADAHSHWDAVDGGLGLVDLHAPGVQIGYNVDQLNQHNDRHPHVDRHDDGDDVRDADPLPERDRHGQRVRQCHGQRHTDGIRFWDTDGILDTDRHSKYERDGERDDHSDAVQHCIGERVANCQQERQSNRQRVRERDVRRHGESHAHDYILQDRIGDGLHVRNDYTDADCEYDWLVYPEPHGDPNGDAVGDVHSPPAQPEYHCLGIYLANDDG